jgi:anaerobic magnesium-protoporphyrin IX monomethyl ester cyclase
MAQDRMRPIKRVMLIFPPMYDIRQVDTMVCPPMGIASLAAYVRDMVDIALLDCLVEAPDRRVPVRGIMERVGLSYDDIVARIRAFAPDMVGLSCLFSGQAACVREISRRIKADIDRDIVVVTGGTHPSFLPEIVLNSMDVDYVVIGEGELGLRAIIEAHNRGGGRETIDGIAWRENGQVRINPRTKWIEDLDTLPFPARDLLPMEKYYDAMAPMGLHWRKKRNAPIVSSRGCPHACPFCSSWRHWGGRFRKRSAENVLAEIAHLREQYGVQELKWQDDNLTTDRQRARAIFSGMKERGLTMPWNTPNGVALWTLDEEMIRLMKQSGCYEITLAVESGSRDSFDAFVKKPFTFDKVREVAGLAKKYGIGTVGYFIIGFPGESLAAIRRSMRFALDLKLDYICPFIFNPLPGSALWEKCQKEGYIQGGYAYHEANNYFQSDLATGNFTTADLRRIQVLTYFTNLCRFPLLNPRGFLDYYSRQLLWDLKFLRTFFIHAFQALTFMLKKT